MNREQFEKLFVNGIKGLYVADSQLPNKDLDINEMIVTHRLALHLPALF